MDADMRPKNASQHVRFAAVLVVAVLAAAILLTVRSYSYSDHLTYSDVELSTDEGLFSMMVPMARLAPGHEARNDWQTYTLFKANAHNARLGSFLTWLCGASYGTFKDIRNKHFRHHVDNDDVVWFDYEKFFAYYPLIYKLTCLLE